MVVVRVMCLIIIIHNKHHHHHSFVFEIGVDDGDHHPNSNSIIFIISIISFDFILCVKMYLHNKKKSAKSGLHVFVLIQKSCTQMAFIVAKNLADLAFFV